MKSLGQIAYEAYAKKVDWKSPFTGQTFKEWDTLKIMNPIVAEAWECAALMVVGQPRLKVFNRELKTIQGPGDESLLPQKSHENFDH